MEDSLIEERRRAIYDKAMRLIGQRSHAVAQLRLKLRRSFRSDASLVEEVLQVLVDEDYLDDARYARERIESCLRRRVEGRRKVLARLLQDGVARETAQDALDTCLSEEQERVLLFDFFRQQRELGVELDRCLRLMANRGFSYDLVHSVMQEESDTIGL